MGFHGCKASRSRSRSRACGKVFVEALDQKHPGDASLLTLASESQLREEPDGSEKDGHFPWKKGVVLNARYELQSSLGDGAFGRVLLASDQSRTNQVALKIIRDVRKYRESAELEARILEDIHKADPTASHGCVVFQDSFLHDGRFFCLVFEPLGKSLYDLLQANDFRGYWLQDIQSFAQQTLFALKFLHQQLLLTHTDIKPENILLQSMEPAQPSYFPRAHFQADASGSLYFRAANSKIKLIDFGNATYKDMHHSSLINTRHYRGPEVLLGLPWNVGSDLWSLGCVMMELYTGSLLFDTHSTLEHLALMQQILGPLPQEILSSASRKVKKRYLLQSPDGMWWLDWPARLGLRSQITRAPETSLYHVCSQWHLSELAPPEHQEFLRFVGRMLTLEPSRRPDAKELLEEAFLHLRVTE